MNIKQEVTSEFNEYGALLWREWRTNGKLDRLDGPAYESNIGKDTYWINGVRYLDFENWEEEVSRIYEKYKLDNLIDNVKLEEKIVDIATEKNVVFVGREKVKYANR